MQDEIVAPRPGETIPRSKAAIAAVHSLRKRRAVQQAMRAPFFRGKLDGIGLDRLDDPREWAKIPLLDKDMLRAMSDREFYRDFCLPPAPDDPVAQYWRSGGTTGRPLEIGTLAREFESSVKAPRIRDLRT